MIHYVIFETINLRLFKNHFNFGVDHIIISYLVKQQHKVDAKCQNECNIFQVIEISCQERHCTLSVCTKINLRYSWWFSGNILFNFRFNSLHRCLLSSLSFCFLLSCQFCLFSTVKYDSNREMNNELKKIVLPYTFESVQIYVRTRTFMI